VRGVALGSAFITVAFMAFKQYFKSRIGPDTSSYELREDIHLFGCNIGLIPLLLRLKLPPAQGEPCTWHLDLLSDLAVHPKYASSALVIDLKPKQSKTTLHLYELLDIWGSSHGGWTAILLHLNALFVDEDPSFVNINSFIRKDTEIMGPIYEFLYINGSVQEGRLSGKWTPPQSSPTNAPLLWPDDLKYFFTCIRDTTPDVLH